MGCKQRKRGILDTEWSQRDHAAFPQIHGQQVGMVGAKTANRSDPVHLTVEMKGWTPEAGCKSIKKFLKTNSDLEAQNSTVNAAQCHNGPRTLWLLKLENAVDQSFKWNTLPLPINPSLPRTQKKIKSPLQF